MSSFGCSQNVNIKKINETKKKKLIKFMFIVSIVVAILNENYQG